MSYYDFMDLKRESLSKGKIDKMTNVCEFVILFANNK